jgi:hypothetical protein
MMPIAATASAFALRRGSVLVSVACSFPHHDRFLRKFIAVSALFVSLK